MAAPAKKAAKTKKQVSKAGAKTTRKGGGSLLDEPILVVNQKMKIIELTNEYLVMNADGEEIGAVCEVGQSTAKKALRFVSSLDQFLTHSYEIRDAKGNMLLQMTRPRKFVKSSFLVNDAKGKEIGKVVQENVFGKIRFGFEAGGKKVGSLNAKNWRAWDFHVFDASDNQVALVTKTWEGLARTMFTTADNYVVEIPEKLSDPLRSLVVAAALCIDTALKQDERGFN